MNGWKIIESLPHKIETQQDLRGRGSWIAPWLLVLPGFVPIWLGIAILPIKIVCQPVSVNSVRCEKKHEFLGITLQSQSYTELASKPQPSTEVIEGNIFTLLIGVTWVGGLSSLLLLSTWLTVTVTTFTIEKATNQISVSKKTAFRQSTTTYLISDMAELLLKLCSNNTTVENFASAAVDIRLKTRSGRSLLLCSQAYDQLPQIDKFLVNLSQLINIPYKLVLDLGLEVWKFESSGEITAYKLGKCFAEYTFKDIATVETEDREKGQNTNNVHRYRVNLITTNGKRLGISEFLSEDLDANNTSYAKIRANQVRDRLIQFINLPAAP